MSEGRGKTGPDIPEMLVTPRPLSQWEREMMNRFLGVDFPGRDIARQQLDSAVVIGEYRQDPAVVLGTRVDAPLLRLPDGVPVWGSIPVDLRTPPTAGSADIVCALLLIRDGLIAELELYRADGGGRVAKDNPPAPHHFQISVDSLSDWVARFVPASQGTDGSGGKDR